MLLLCVSISRTAEEDHRRYRSGHEAVVGSNTTDRHRKGYRDELARYDDDTRPYRDDTRPYRDHDDRRHHMTYRPSGDHRTSRYYDRDDDNDPGYSPR